MTTSKTTFGYISAERALSAQTLADRVPASPVRAAAATPRNALPIASEWLNESELAAVRKAVGPVNLQITDSILSKLKLG